jgi:tryptophan halogenase
VYSSAYSTDEEARQILMANLEGNVRVELRLLKFKTGRRRSAWAKNCVSIGLAGGFVEPLESTSIHLIQSGITRLLRLFPISGCSEALQRQYNQESRGEYERIRDFIVLHYKATERDDTPYWRDCRDMAIPDSLAHRIELFRETGLIFPDAQDVFRVDSWLQVMVGQRIKPNAYHFLARLSGDEKLRTMLATLRGTIGDAVAKMPTHKEFLDSYCLVKEDLKAAGAK